MTSLAVTELRNRSVSRHTITPRQGIQAQSASHKRPCIEDDRSDSESPMEAIFQQPSGVSSQMRGTHIYSPDVQALRTSVMETLEAAFYKRQRLSQQKGWLMEIDSKAQENVEALRSQVQQLKSDADFSQQELESLKAAANQFAAQTHEASLASRFYTEQAEREIIRLKEVEEQ